MISENLLVRRLEAERENLRRTNPHTDFVLGIIYGLRVASHIAHTLWEETKSQLIENPKYLGSIRSHFSNRKYIVRETPKRAARWKRTLTLKG